MILFYLCALLATQFMAYLFSFLLNVDGGLRVILLSYLLGVNFVITLISSFLLFFSKKVRTRYKILFYLLPMIISFLFWTTGTVYDGMRTGKFNWTFFTMLAGPELLIMVFGILFLRVLKR